MLLEKFSKKFGWTLAVLITVAGATMMIYAAKTDSATMDELAHIPAAYSYIKLQDNRLNPEHPPLLKDLAGIPLIFLDLKFPIESDSWQKQANGQWDVGQSFIYKSGNNADQIIFWSRLGSIFLTVLTALLLYCWSIKMIGPIWGLLPFSMFIFSPFVLSHGHYVTTDIAAAFGAIVSFWTFTEFLKKPNMKTGILASLGFGLAQLAKFSLFLILPIFAFLATFAWLLEIFKEKKHFGKIFFQKIGGTILIIFAGFALVCLVYIPQNFNYPVEKQKADAEEILNEKNPENYISCQDFKSWTKEPKKCAYNLTIKLSGNKIAKPFAQYLLGLMMVFKRASAGNTGYFMGEVSNLGWRSYFPIVFLAKETLPALIMIFAAIFMAISSIFRLDKKHINQGIFGWIWRNFSEFSILLFAIVYWIVSVRSPLNIGVRHLMPILPLMYLLSASVFKRTATHPFSSKFFDWKEIKNSGYKAALLPLAAFILIAWQATIAFKNSPNFLSYYNPLAGGRENGYKIAVDSNYDWGQDLKRLEKFASENKIEKIKIDYFGGGNPEYYFGNKFEQWRAEYGKPEFNSWLAISATFLQNSSAKKITPLENKTEKTYSWLSEYQPYAKAGDSIFIFKF